MSNPWDDLENSSENKRKRGASSDKKSEGAQSSSKSDNDIFGRSFFKEDKSDNDFFGGFFSNLLKGGKNKKESVIEKIETFSNFKLFMIGCAVVAVLWLVSGFYIVRQEENGIVMRFGRYVRDAESGLHYHAPYPIEEVIKEATTRVRVLKIGGEDASETKLGEGWALTGDENIVNLELNVQWKIDDLKKFVFSVRDREQTIYDATQSAIREVVSKRKLASILTSDRGDIEEETKKLLQDMLNSYDIGVSVLLVQMLKIDPPAQVIDSFRDVQTARVDKESEINKAYKYKNDILPKVRGEAGKILEDAQGYAISVVNRAKGDASRFNQVYEQYKSAPFVTRKRMYLDAMEELFSKNKVMIVDDNVKNVFLDGKNISNEEKAAADNSDDEQ